MLDTRDVTERNSPASSGEFQKVSPERETAPEDSSLQPEAITARERLVDLLQRSRAYWVPPSLLTDPPASVTELTSYARYAGWTARADGPMRRLGVTWLYTVGLPVTVVCRYSEWVAQRPGRAIPVFVVWKLFVTTGPGPWMVEHLFRPILATVAWVLL